MYSLIESSAQTWRKHSLNKSGLMEKSVVVLSVSTVCLILLQMPFSEALSVFGRVILNGTTYSSDHGIQNSAAWNSSLLIVQKAYSNSNVSHNGISILEILNNSRSVVVHFKITIPDKTFLASNYSVTGADFEPGETIISQGGKKFMKYSLFCAAG